MNLSGLSLDNIPPLRTPLGFFLLAPLFGVLAGALLVGQPQLLGNRWQGSTLAFTHLLTLGFGAMVMLGALFQVLPVVSNRAIPRGASIAPGVRWGLAVGAGSLALGFISGLAVWFQLAVVALGASLLVFIAAFASALARARPAGDTTFTLRLAALALLITLGLGAAQLSLRFWPDAGLYHPDHTRLHALWGGYGWVLLLIMGVSFQVIPMFHVAPAFPLWSCRSLPPALLVANLIALFSPWPSVRGIAIMVMLPMAIAYAIAALRVLSRRKRKLVDYTVRFWQLGLGHLMLVSALALTLQIVERADRPAAFEMLLGLGFGLGFVVSVILGMLQKIVPFLIYLHLQRLAMSDPGAMMLKLPHMKALISTDRSRWQFRLHLATLITLYGGVWFAPLASVAGLLMVGNFAWLAVSVWGAWSQYRGFETRVRELTRAH